MTTDDHFDLGPEIPIAQRHMSRLANQLIMKFGMLDAIGLLLGAATGVLTYHCSKAEAVRWLRELADEIEANQGGDTVGHA